MEHVALEITAARPDPALLDLPWELPLETWPAEQLAALPRGISRHVVRFVRLSDRVLAVKEIKADIAVREYHMLRDARAPATCPASSRSASSAAATAADGTGSTRACSPGTCSSPCPTAPCSARRCGPTRPSASSTPSPCCWCACTSPASGGVTSRCPTPCSAAMPAPSRPTSSTPRPASCTRRSPAGQREHDLEIARVNIAGELMDLEAGGLLHESARPHRDLRPHRRPLRRTCGTSSPGQERFETRRPVARRRSGSAGSTSSASTSTSWPSRPTSAARRSRSSPRSSTPATTRAGCCG